MDNPYKVLGVNENASQDEIKKAYRELVKKYHPDKYVNNPLKNLAEEKMREINEAYDCLTKNSQNSTYSNSRSSYSNNSSNADYYSIRNDLNRGDVSSAERKLNTINSQDAEWFFLMGNVYARKGWYDNAFNYIQKACNMNPGNREYMAALQNLQMMNNSYRRPYNMRGYSDRDSSFCDLCVSLWCADSLCNCMGGGC